MTAKLLRTWTIQPGYVKGLASLVSKQAQLSSFSCNLQKARLSITVNKCIQFDTQSYIHICHTWNYTTLVAIHLCESFLYHTGIATALWILHSHEAVSMAISFLIHVKFPIGVCVWRRVQVYVCVCFVQAICIAIDIHLHCIPKTKQ